MSDEAIDGRRATELFEAPERGSADELLDAGAHGELDAMRHSRGARHGRGGPGPLPGHASSASARPSTTASTTTSLLPRPLTPDDLAGDRGADARERRRRPPVRPPRAAARPRAAPFFAERGQPFKVEILDDLAAQGRARRRRRCRRRLVLRARPVHRPVQGPARRVAPARSARSSCSPSPARTGAATRSGRCSSASTARSGRPRRSSTSTCGGARRRRSATTAGSASSSTCSASTTSRPGSAFWHPKGQTLWRTLESAMRELQERRGYQEISTPIARQQAAVGAVRPLGPLPRATCSSSSPRSQTFSLKPMNCPESTFIYRSRVRSYRDLPLRLSRVRPAPSQRAVRDAVRADARPPVRPGRRAHLRPAGPARRRDRGAARRGPRGLRLVRPRAALHLRDAAGQGARRPGAVGAGRGADPGGARPRPASTTGQAEGRHVLRAQDRHLDRRRARPRVADGHDPGRPRRCCPSGSTCTTSTRRASSSARSPSTARSTARSSGSSASSSSTSPGAFPLWLAPVQAVVIPIADRHIEAAGELAGVLRGARPAGRGRRRPTTGCRTRSGWPRSRRCRTCSSSAIARSRHGPRRRGRGPASSSRPSLGGLRRPPRGRGSRATRRLTEAPRPGAVDCRLAKRPVLSSRFGRAGSSCRRAGRLHGNRYRRG